MSALLMLPLLAFAGFAVDIGSWYMYANRMQRAADAAALAGVVWMPNDEKAEAIALETAKANGFDDAAADITVTVTPVGNRRLRVNIVDTSVDMYFSKLFLSSVDIQRQSLAEYVQAIPMGSPDNILGNDPEKIGTAGYTLPYYWLNVSAPTAQKAQGDRYTANDCTSSFSGCTAGNNLDYSDSGYFYRMTVDTKPASGNLTFQAFDPEFMNQQSKCSANQLSSTAATFTSQIATLVAQGHADAATRYARGETEWCTADTSGSGYGAATMKTTFIVRAPDNTPFDNFDNPIICGKTFDAYDQDLFNLLDQTGGGNNGNIGSENMAFDDVYRQWVTLCTVNWSSVAFGDYLLQVTSTADRSNPISSLGTYDSTVATGGYNKFSLRAGFGTPGSSTYASGVNVFADGRLPIFVNQAPSAGTQFYLARIVPEYAGQMLELELFDVGDGSPANLTVVPPTDMTGSGIAGCTFIRDASPPTSTSSTTCTINGLTADTGSTNNFNGRLLTVQVPLPDNYGCAAGTDLGCWFKIQLIFTEGGVTDQTTWSARVRGDPVRIVE
jgi:Flp pilus assembly protein TadG